MNKKKFSVITYNIDGLPEQLDLNDLPWIFKPIVWIYKLIKKTTLITINDGTDKENSIETIAQRLSKSDFDIIAVQEDFNYHDILDQYIIPEGYSPSTYTGGFDLKKIFSSTEWLTKFPLPRFKADGLGLWVKKTTITGEENEYIKRWKKSYGYFTHANDALTHKGYRRYGLMFNKKYPIDLYIVHMDADFYHPINCPDVSKDVKARASQLQQLTKDIIENSGDAPVIIVGDTNSSSNYTWDVQNITDNLINPINSQDNLEISEAINKTKQDVDRVFFINNSKASFRIEVDNAYYDDAYNNLSDHLPFVVEFNII